MKINYRKNMDGKRSTITINDELIYTWIAVLEHEKKWESREAAILELVEKIEETKTEGPGTFISRVEAHMMGDIREAAQKLAMVIEKIKAGRE